VKIEIDLSQDEVECLCEIIADWEGNSDDDDFYYKTWKSLDKKFTSIREKLNRIADDQTKKKHK
jgi:hypothetical protein